MLRTAILSSSFIRRIGPLPPHFSHFLLLARSFSLPHAEPAHHLPELAQVDPETAPASLQIEPQPQPASQQIQIAETLASKEVLRAFPRNPRFKYLAKVRELGRIPAVLIDGEKSRWPRKLSKDLFLSLESRPIFRLLKLLGKRDFLTRVFDMEIYKSRNSMELTERLQVLPRNLNYGPGKTHILNIQLLRAPPDKLLKLGIPLEYRGEENCPGLMKGGTLKRLAKFVVYNCKASELPAKIVVDMTVLEIGDTVVVGDLEVDLDLLHSEKSMPVCEITKEEVKSRGGKQTKRVKSNAVRSRKGEKSQYRQRKTTAKSNDMKKQIVQAKTKDLEEDPKLLDSAISMPVSEIAEENGKLHDGRPNKSVKLTAGQRQKIEKSKDRQEKITAKSNDKKLLAVKSKEGKVNQEKKKKDTGASKRKAPRQQKSKAVKPKKIRKL